MQRALFSYYCSSDIIEAGRKRKAGDIGGRALGKKVRNDADTKDEIKKGNPNRRKKVRKEATRSIRYADRDGDTRNIR